MKTIIPKKSGKSLVVTANSKGQDIPIIFTKVSRQEFEEAKIQVYKPLVP